MTSIHAATPTDPHAALMQGHDHEGLSERARHSHGESVERSKIEDMIPPYLKQHIPNQYNPLGGGRDGKNTTSATANTKYCYRHRPDLLCRRQADEPSMEQLQVVCTSPLTPSSATDGNRNLAENHRPTSRASPTCGRSSPPRPLVIATSCCKASSPNAAFPSSPSSPRPSATSSRSTFSPHYPPSWASRYSAIWTRPHCATPRK
jgi:hypothetical protein